MAKKRQKEKWHTVCVNQKYRENRQKSDHSDTAPAAPTAPGPAHE
jgi:hypothetical protein